MTTIELSEEGLGEDPSKAIEDLRATLERERGWSDTTRSGIAQLAFVIGVRALRAYAAGTDVPHIKIDEDGHG